MPHYARQRIVSGINFAMVKRKARYCGSILSAVRIWSFAVRGLNWKGHQFQDQPREVRNSPLPRYPRPAGSTTLRLRCQLECASGTTTTSPTNSSKKPSLGSPRRSIPTAPRRSGGDVPLQARDCRRQSEWRRARDPPFGRREDGVRQRKLRANHAAEHCSRSDARWRNT
jgi:hypothetical protein